MPNQISWRPCGAFLRGWTPLSDHLSLIIFCWQWNLHEQCLSCVLGTFLCWRTRKIVYREVAEAGEVWNKSTNRDVPLRGEVHKLWGELVGRKLGRRFFHHLLQLLKRRPPCVIGEVQDGELDLTKEWQRSCCTPTWKDHQAHTNLEVRKTRKENKGETNIQSLNKVLWSCKFLQ